ncbi:MAG: hypothetical protein ACR2JF_04525 [Iamia sp.]
MGLAVAGVTVLALVLVVAVVVVIGGGDDDADLTASEMRGALLTEADVDGEHREVPNRDDEDDEFRSEDLDASDECLQLFREGTANGFSLAVPSEDQPMAEVRFEAPDDALVQHSITTDAGDPLAAIRALTGACGEVTFDVDGAAGRFGYSLGEPVVDVGDDSLTLIIDYEITEPARSAVQLLDVLWVRSGLLSQLSVSTGSRDDGVLTAEDRALLVDLVAVADERLVEVIDEDG